MNKIIKIFSFIFTKIQLLFTERTYQGRLKYVYKNKHSDMLVISFSALSRSNIPVYNYQQTLKNAQCDQLFILDNFGYRGSYYWYENGRNIPEQLVIGLITKILSEKRYQEIYTIGSSKGGSAAIYYGLKFNVTGVYSAACQYKIGTYLFTVPQHQPIFHKMMGKQAGEKECQLLNEKLPNLLKDSQGTKTCIHLLYSTKEVTYEMETVFLLKDLQLYKIPYTEQVEHFSSHSDVGNYFIPLLKKKFLG